MMMMMMRIIITIIIIMMMIIIIMCLSASRFRSAPSLRNMRSQTVTPDLEWRKETDRSLSELVHCATSHAECIKQLQRDAEVLKLMIRNKDKQLEQTQQQLQQTQQQLQQLQADTATRDRLFSEQAHTLGNLQGTVLALQGVVEATASQHHAPAGEGLSRGARKRRNAGARDDDGGRSAASSGSAEWGWDSWSAGASTDSWQKGK
jgi:FtsZ-interacting cell division protein ZipA